MTSSPETTLRSKASEVYNSLRLDELNHAGIVRNREHYYLNIAYPSLQAMNPITEDAVFEDAVQSDDAKSAAIYTHVPFCSRACMYCHYYKVFNKPVEVVDRYVHHLELELKLLASRFGAVRAESVYIGGGTPSYLTVRQIRRLFGLLHTYIDISSRIEVSFEVHPENARPELFDVLRSVGVNRISIGVESFDDGILRSEHRRHTAQQAIDAFVCARSAGFENVNLDLIYGLQYQTPALWEQTLATVGELQPPSACMYYLRLKRETADFQIFRRKPNSFPSEKELLLMHIMTFEAMNEYGYTQDIVDWFIRDKSFEHDYQKTNWQTTDRAGLIGLGPSAYSYVNGVQYYNVNDLATYESHVENGRLPLWRGEKLTSTEERMRRSLLLGLKTRVSRQDFASTYAQDPLEVFSKTFDELHKLGLVTIDAEAIELTYEGRLFADEVGWKFYSPEMRRRMDMIPRDLVSTTSPLHN